MARYEKFFIQYEGEKLSFYEVSAIAGLAVQTVYTRRCNGWTDEEILLTPRYLTPDRIKQLRKNTPPVHVPETTTDPDAMTRRKAMSMKWIQPVTQVAAIMAEHDARQAEVSAAMRAPWGQRAGNKRGQDNASK